MQIKRIHEYKRQYLNILSIIWKYKQLKKMTPAERKNACPRVCIIGGKAASAYDMAKRIIRLVTAVGAKINHDPDTKDYLRLYFMSDYNVSLAEVGGKISSINVLPLAAVGWLMRTLLVLFIDFSRFGHTCDIYMSLTNSSCCLPAIIYSADYHSCI
jgi:hypothetical protein